MKSNLLRLLSLTIVFFFIAGCFGPPKSDNREEREREREKRERKHRKKNMPERVKNLRFATEEDEEEGGENEKYDGIMAAQQREFDMTHDPTTNTIPKERLINALSQRSASIVQQLNSPVATGANGTTAGIDAISWVERGSYKDSAGPYGNQRDSIASTSGRMHAFLADKDPSKPNQVFVGGIDGGLWSCSDITVASPTWTFIDNFSNLGISSICQDPTNYNIMYFGTGEKTFNADAVRGGGIWKSTNHGATWTLLPNTVGYYNVSKVLCDNGGNVYVGTISSGAGLLRSTNGGASWTTITPTVSSLTTSRVSDMVYDPANDRMHVYMGYFPTAGTTLVGYVYATPSTVTSATWSVPTTGAGMAIAVAATPSTNANYEQMVELAVKNGVVYGLRGNYGNMTVYQSLDGGDNWTTQSTLTAAQYGVGQDWYSMGIDCDPVNPASNVIIGNLNVFKSTNGGTSFTQVSEWVKGNYTGQTQYVHADVHAIYYNTNPDGQNRVVVSCDGGVFYSANGGTNWADRNIGLRVKQFYSCAVNPIDPNYFLAGAQDNGSHQFKQPGLGISTEVTGGDGAIVAIDQQTSVNQITSYVYNSYHISTDNGNTWSSNTFGSSAGLFINPFDFDGKTKKLYAAYTPGTYLRWDDPTTTQSTTAAVSVASVIGATTTLTAVTVSPNLSNTIYVAGGVVVAKISNANTATPTIASLAPPVTAGSYISSIILGPSTTDQDIMVTVSSYGSTIKKVLVTNNGGSTWADITGNLPDMPVRWAMFYPGGNTQALLATEAGIWYTTAINGASTVWQASLGFPAVRCDMIKYSPVNDVIAVGTHGRGLWSTRVSTTPKVSFYNSILNIAKYAATGLTASCRRYKDYSDSLIISDGPNGAATVTLSVQAGSTAKRGVDFDFTTNGSFTTPSSVATFNSGVYPNKIPVTIRVYDNHDKNAPQPSVGNIVYTISGSTDAVVSPSNQVLSLTLSDVFPPLAPLTAQTLWNENWENWPATANVWNFTPDIYYGSPANAVAFVPYYSGCSGNINTNTAQLLSSNASGGIAYCANVPGAYTARMYRAVSGAAGHYSNMSLRFNYKSGANTNITNSLIYSINNGTTWDTLATYASQTTTGTSTIALPAALNNIDFLLGWQSIGTSAATYSAFGFSIDNILLTGDIAALPIDSTAATMVTNYEAAGQSIDFISSRNNIFANIASSSADLGCLSVSIENGGATWQPYLGGNRSQKTFLITPATNGSTASYSTTLYFTTNELAGRNPANLRIAKTTATSIAASNTTNTIAVVPTIASYNSYGVAFTGNFTGFSRYFLVDAGALPITLLDFRATLVNRNTEVSWTTTDELNNSGFDVETSRDGVNFVKMGFVAAKGNGSTATSTYNYTHIKPQSGVNYYRLKQIDKDGKFVYTKIVAINIGDNGIVKPFLYPIPAKDAITLNFGTITTAATVSIYSNDMKLIRSEKINESVVTRDFDISSLSSGIYFIVVNVNGKPETLRFVKQ